MVTVVDDATRWNVIHQKTHNAGNWQSHYAEEKEKLFPRHAMVVDLGGGTGEDALYFLQKGHSVVLFDISPTALQIAEQKAKAVNLQTKLVARQLDYGLHKIPVKDGSVDVVYSRISLNYFDAVHTSRLFTHVYSILKPGGSAYLSFKSPVDKDEMDYLEKIAVYYEPNVFIENGMLRSRFTREQLNEMLVKAGIKDFSVVPFTEDLAGRKTGHQQTLYLNEVTFSKPA